MNLLIALITLTAVSQTAESCWTSSVSESPSSDKSQDANSNKPYYMDRFLVLPHDNFPFVFIDNDTCEYQCCSSMQMSNTRSRQHALYHFDIPLIMRWNVYFSSTEKVNPQTNSYNLLKSTIAWSVSKGLCSHLTGKMDISGIE